MDINYIKFQNNAWLIFNLMMIVFQKLIQNFAVFQKLWNTFCSGADPTNQLKRSFKTSGWDALTPLSPSLSNSFCKNHQWFGLSLSWFICPSRCAQLSAYRCRLAPKNCLFPTKITMRQLIFIIICKLIHTLDCLRSLKKIHIVLHGTSQWVVL